MFLPLLSQHHTLYQHELGVNCSSPTQRYRTSHEKAGWVRFTVSPRVWIPETRHHESVLTWLESLLHSCERVSVPQHKQAGTVSGINMGHYSYVMANYHLFIITFTTVIIVKLVKKSFCFF